MCAGLALNGQTFYFLDKTSGQIRPVALEGVTPPWLATFNDLYFARDNPWIRVSERLHRPGVVRPNERLDAFMREDDVVANVTLLREPGMPTFDRHEVAAFERLSRHMTRALRLAVRLEHAEATGLGMAALDSLRHADHRRGDATGRYLPRQPRALLTATTLEPNDPVSHSALHQL